MIKPFQSETIGKVASALRKAQADYPPLPKNKKAGKPGGKQWSYADLTQVLEIMLPILSKNGLSFHQSEQFIDGNLLLFTQLSHEESGEWFGSYKPLFPQDKTDQGYGSSMSYQRRYSAYALLGIFPSDEDDDAVEAKESHHHNQVPGCISEKQAGLLLARTRGRSELLDKILKRYSITEVKNIPFKDFSMILEWLEKELTSS